MATANLDLDGLRAFLTVAEVSSFSRAGEFLGRTQSAVSLQLARLEKRLGKVLLLRCQGRVLGLTDDGRELLPFARRIVDLNDAAYRTVAQPSVSGRVRLGVPADFMDDSFPELLRCFQRLHQGVEIDVVSDLSERLRGRVREGGMDVAFFKRLPGEGEGTTVIPQHLAWMGGPAAVVPPPDQPVPLVLFPDGCIFRALAVRALEKAGRRWRPAYVCPSIENVLAAIRSGLGLGALPRHLAPTGIVGLEGQLPALGDVELAFAVARDGGSASKVLAAYIARRVRERNLGGTA